MSILFYLAAIVATNLAFGMLGLVSLFGLTAPIAALFAGAPFAIRDAVQRRYGYGVTLAAIAVACGLTALMSPALALASAVAFAASELLDLTAFAALRTRLNFFGSSALSNVAGAVVDSAIFLTIAFGSLAFFPGQVVAKVLTGTAASAVLALRRRR